MKMSYELSEIFKELENVCTILGEWIGIGFKWTIFVLLAIGIYFLHFMYKIIVWIQNKWYK